MYLLRRSCTSAKSAITFCKSRMLRKKSFDISLAGLIVRGGARGGPVREKSECVLSWGGGGWRARYAGTMTKNKAPAMGRIEKRYGSRQTKVRTAKREMVWDGVLHVRRRSRRFWKTKTTPILRPIVSVYPDVSILESLYLALNRRKLLVIRGNEKLGRLMYFDERTSCGKSNSSTSSSGMTCCSSLRRFRLALHFLKEVLMVMVAHFVKRRSCSE